MTEILKFEDGVSVTLTDEVTKTGVYWTHKFTYRTTNRIDDKILELDTHYIITNWQTRCEIKGESDGGFIIKECLGADLVLGEEYLLIKPTY